MTLTECPTGHLSHQSESVRQEYIQGVFATLVGFALSDSINGVEIIDSG